MKKCLLYLASILILHGCNDVTGAENRVVVSHPGNIQCYSGGTLIYSGNSAGDITGDATTDAYVFTDQDSQKLTAVTGDCVVIYD